VLTIDFLYEDLLRVLSQIEDFYFISSEARKKPEDLTARVDGVAVLAPVARIILPLVFIFLSLRIFFLSKADSEKDPSDVIVYFCCWIFSDLDRLTLHLPLLLVNNSSLYHFCYISLLLSIILSLPVQNYPPWKGKGQIE
jgi:hypothetical protein